MAHCYFRQSSDGTHVQFLMVEVTKDSTGLILERLYEYNFTDHFDTMERICIELVELGETLKTSSNFNKLAEAMAQVPPNLFTKDSQ